MKWLIGCSVALLMALSIGALEAAETVVDSSQHKQGTPTQLLATSVGVPVQTVAYRNWRYRYHNGRWWYWSPNNYWMYWGNNRWYRHGYGYARPYAYGYRSYPGRYYSGYRGYPYRYNYGSRYYGSRYYGPRVYGGAYLGPRYGARYGRRW